MIKNAQGKIFYGMHFYPGVAEYQEEGKDSFRIFINDDTIRKMGPSFEGRPVFLEHVDEVNGKPLSEQRAQDIKKEADGWVIESFFNKADGKHWVKFVVVTERALRAIDQGFRLSNAYHPTLLVNRDGVWNGVPYQQEVKNGEFDHLALVDNPRYDESVVMSPQEFKEYNEGKLEELTLLANSQSKKGDKKVKLNFFKRTKSETEFDADLMVTLPKSKKEVSIVSLVNEADEMEEKKKKNEVMADPKHMVKMDDGSMMNVGDMMAEHKEMKDRLDSMDNEEELETEEVDPDVESQTDNEDTDGMGEDDPAVGNEDDEEGEDKKKPAKKNSTKKKPVKKATRNDADDLDEDEEEIEDEDVQDEDEVQNSADRKRAAKVKADKLRNARERVQNTVVMPNVTLSEDRVALGKSRYGS